MALSSMTGFARKDGSARGFVWAWEVRSVNGRGFDLRLRLPGGWDRIDPPVREYAQKRFGRGSISASLTISGAEAAGVHLDEAALAAALALAERVRRLAGSPPVTVEALLAMPGVLSRTDSGAADDESAAEVVAGFAAAADALAAARVVEGAALGEILDRHLDEIGRLTNAARALAEAQPERMRQRIVEQVRRLLDAAPMLDAARLHQEAALVAARADIAEEIDRLAAHVDQGRRLVSAGGMVGRKLDFLAQELGREANTLCSKAGELDLTRVGLDLKLAVEKLREQVQNVE